MGFIIDVVNGGAPCRIGSIDYDFLTASHWPRPPRGFGMTRSSGTIIGHGSSELPPLPLRRMEGDFWFVGTIRYSTFGFDDRETHFAFAITHPTGPEQHGLNIAPVRLADMPEDT
jgi:hypothetical protein